MNNQVFEILCEYSEGDSKEIISERKYVTAPSLASACVYSAEHAYQYERDLVSVRYVQTITERITEPQTQSAIEQWRSRDD